MNSIYYFDIDDELFKEIKGNINIGINDILDGMSEKNVSEGEMSLSVKIVLLPELVTDVNGKQKRILIPHIEHKTSTKMTVKKSRYLTRNMQKTVIWHWKKSGINMLRSQFLKMLLR